MSSTPAPFIRGLVAVLAILALILAMDTLRLFAGQQWLSSLIGIETQYFYALLALLAPWVFITFPSKPWIDWPLALAFVAILLGFFVTAEQALDEAWEFAAPTYAVYASLALWLMLLEALRHRRAQPLILELLHREPLTQQRHLLLLCRQVLFQLRWHRTGARRSRRARWLHACASHSCH